MTVRDCFFSASIPHLGSAFPVFILLLFSFSFVTKFYFHLQNTFLKSEEFCLFESYEDGQDISCRSMMFGASRFLWGAPFVFSAKTERLEYGVVHFLTLSFSLSLPAKTGPLLETRIYQRITTFVLFVLLVFVYCYDCLGKALVFFLIEVGRIAMGSA